MAADLHEYLRNKTLCYTHRTAIQRRGLPAWAILLLIVVVLVVVGFTTGWIQKTFELNL